ncbi:MAG: hypothetical protein JSW52_05350 [Candidatus Coatesbacteria bacterium]|nr:MAG: hypothetical protein JSW52_05350 [Candidatus Coatesbacteria bacterium]
MRNVLLLVAVLAVATPALAGREEQILQQSDDTMETYWSLDYAGRAQWFEAPVDCHVINASFYVYGDGNKAVGVWENDDSGYYNLPGTLLGYEWFDFGGDFWHWSPYVDLTGEEITVTGGDKFWVGIQYYSGYEPYIGLDTTSPYHGVAYTYDGTNWTSYYYYDMLVRVKIDDDMDGPYVDGQDPADGGWAVPETSIFFHCKDDDKGVKSGSIDFSADDGTRAEIPGSLYIDDSNPNDVICIFEPDSDLPEGATITCTVAGTLADGLGNEMGADEVWSFTVGYSSVEEASLGEIKAGYH